MIIFIDDYVRKLFRKECFADQSHFSAQEVYEIIPKKYLIRRNHNPEFKAFKPIDKLRSDKESNLSSWKALKSVKNKISMWFENFDNDNGNPPLALRVVPLPGFIRNNFEPKNDMYMYTFKRIILNILWFIFIPRWYKINRNEKSKLSPFSRVIQYENNDDLYDNPATEAVINFCWPKARNFLFFLFFRFLIFGTCFGYVSWRYLVHDDTKEFQNLLIASIFIFYYLTIYLFSAKMIQLYYYGIRKYFGVTYNYFDILSIVIPVVVMSIMLNNSFQFSDGFGSVEEVETQLVVGISFSIFVIWLEVVSLQFQFFILVIYLKNLNNYFFF